MVKVIAKAPFVKNFLIRMAIALVLTTILSAAGIVVVNDMIDSRFDNLKRRNVNVAEDTGASEPANFLLIGSDTREFVQSEQDRESFTDEDGETGQRSDTMMIIKVDPKAKKTTVMAIPRDTLVDIPGIGKQKINASFNSDLGGGPDKVIETINKNFDITIHHFVEMDFDSFRQIVAALGSVNVYFPAPARDIKAGLDTKMKAGCIALDGPTSLAYVRSRFYEQYIDGQWQADPTSNFGRIARQQEFMRRVAGVAVKKSLTDPLKGRDVADAIIRNLHVDQNLRKDDIFKLMNAFNGVDPNDPEHVKFETLPVKSQLQNGAWNDIIQTAEAEPMLEVFRNLKSESDKEKSVTTLPRPGTVKLRILNASGRTGLAATAINSMQEIGFVPAGTGNASSLVATEIHYTSANKAKAMLVAKHIKGILVQDSAIADADVVVMLGSDFVSVNASGKADSAEPTTSATVARKGTAETTEPPIDGVVAGGDCPA